MNLTTALSFITFGITLGLGIFVYLGNRKQIVNQFFLLLSLSASSWILTVALVPLTASLLFYKISILAAVFVALFLFYFSYHFPKKLFKLPVTAHFFIIIINLVMGIIPLATDLMIKDINFGPDRAILFEYGPMFAYWAIYFISFVFLSLIILVNKYIRAEGIEKVQLRYFLTGLILSITMATTTNLLLPVLELSTAFFQYGPLFLVFTNVFITYSITKHQLMNLKIVTTELLVGMVSIVLLIDLLTSQNLLTGLFKTAILIAFGYLGISLIRGVLLEITRREKIEKISQELQVAYEKLKRLDLAKSEFISIASHQLRTPLSAIKGYVSMILEGTYGTLSEKTKTPLGKVYQANERLIKLVNDLLDISRIEAGKIELEKEMVSLEELLNSAIETFKTEAKKKGLYLKLEKPEEKLPALMLDKEKFSQAILNIIDNAIRYTSEGGIVIILKKEESNVLIEVKDTGEGMDEEELKEIFASFSRGAAGGKYWTEGAGLGLYVSQKFVTMHNGKIWAESEGKNKGSTFYIELPLENNLH